MSGGYLGDVWELSLKSRFFVSIDLAMNFIVKTRTVEK